MKRLLLFLVTGCGLLCNTASAGFSYSVEFDQANYQVTPGSSVTVNVLLRETTTGGDTPRLLIGGGNGLATYDFRMDYSLFTGAQATLPAGTSAATFQSNNTLFDGSGSAVNIQHVLGSTFRFNDDVQSSPFFAEVSGSGSSATMLLGTFNFTAPNTPGTTTLVLSSPTGGTTSEFFFADGFDNSGANFGSFSYGTASITAVPEPTSMALVAVAGAGLAGWRLRRSRKKAQQA